MKVSTTPSALRVIEEIVEFVEAKNTKGSGQRWLTRFEAVLKDLSVSGKALPICKYPLFARKGLRCFTWNKWLIVFNAKPNELKLVAIIYGSNLNY